MPSISIIVTPSSTPAIFISLQVGQEWLKPHRANVKPAILIPRAIPPKGRAVTGSRANGMKREAGVMPALYPQL
jgi:hypothetical protein